MRLGAACQGERDRSERPERLHATQPGMPRHLATPSRAGVFGVRRHGVQTGHRLQSGRVTARCRDIGTRVSMDIDATDGVPAPRRLARAARRGPSRRARGGLRCGAAGARA